MPAVNARHERAERHTRARQRLCFLTAAPEDERVAALQPQNALAFFRKSHQQFANLVLLAALTGKRWLYRFFLAGQRPAGLHPAPARRTEWYRRLVIAVKGGVLRAVIRPGSPGPAPTSHTQPGAIRGSFSLFRRSLSMCRVYTTREPEQYRMGAEHPAAWRWQHLQAGGRSLR